MFHAVGYLNFMVGDVIAGMCEGAWLCCAMSVMLRDTSQSTFERVKVRRVHESSWSTLCGSGATFVGEEIGALVAGVLLVVCV